VTQHLVSADDFVFTSRGPILAHWLKPDAEVLVLDAKGVLLFGRLSALEVRTSVSGARVMTELGEVVLVDGMCLLGRAGPIAAPALRRAIANDVEVQLEGISASGIPASKNEAASAKAIACSVLSHFTTGQFAIPKQVSESLTLSRSLSRLFKEAAIRPQKYEDDRWQAFCFTPPKDPGPLFGGYAERFERLNAVTAWEEVGGRLSARTTDAARTLRAELLLAGASIGLQPHITWTPGYCPVDARISFGSSSTSTFVKVVAMRDEMHDVCAMEVATSRQIVVGMHMLMPARRS
jgi:hypothetical protein